MFSKVMMWLSLLTLILRVSLSLSSCGTQLYWISHQQYLDLFSSDNVLFTNIEGLSCVYQCLIYDQSVEILSAVYVREQRLCSCAASLVTSDASADGIEVLALQLPRPGWLRDN